MNRCLSKRLVPVLLIAIAGLVIPIANLTADTLVEAGGKTVWKYLDDGTQPPADWHQPAFDDSKWKTGRAPLGYGEPEVATTISFGSNADRKHITTYFRHRFEVAGTDGCRQVLLLTRIDDGAVVYLNGKAAIRQNLGAGPINAGATATERIEGSAEQEYHRHLLPATAIVTGVNHLAVEVHQFNAVSSDAFLDLVLKTYGERDEPCDAQLAPAAREITLAYKQGHYVPAGTTIPDGYLDGGRRMEVGAAGDVHTDREVIVVDRSRDTELQKHLSFARSDSVAKLSALERAQRLAAYVDKQCSPPAGRRLAVSAANILEGEYRGKEMLLGKSAGSGVCRHRALLFKILADEAGLSVALVRGNLGDDSSRGGHTWNELDLKDGKKRIVDCMNPRPSYYLPQTSESPARRYFTVENKPYYVETKSAEANRR